MHFFFWNTKKFFKDLIVAPIRVLIIQNRLGRYGAGTREGEPSWDTGCNFSNFLKQTITRPHSLFSVFPLYFWWWKNIFSSPICAFNETKITQFGQRMRKIWGDKYVLDDRQFYPTLGLVQTDQVFLTLSLASCKVVVAGHLPSQGGKWAH